LQPPKLDGSNLDQCWISLSNDSGHPEVKFGH
jgi:hypothetical protein